MPTQTDSKQYILDLLGEIELTDPAMYSPPTASKPGDKVLADASDDVWARRAFCLGLHYASEAKKLKVDLELQETPEGKETYEAMKYKSDLLIDMVWGAIRSRHAIWNANASMRKEWKVVELADEKDDLPEFLKKLFGKQ